MNLIGIRREARFSPNMGEADTAIFEAVADKLRCCGHDVSLVASFAEAKGVAAALGGVANVDALFSMSRDEDTLHEIIDAPEWNALLHVNSAIGIMACADRFTFEAAAAEKGFVTPQSFIIETSMKSVFFTSPCWLKRTSGWSQEREDVVFVRDADEATAALANFHQRGHETVLCSEHIEGDLVKFYGVAGTDFFDWSYADARHSKFGIEAINGTPHGYKFDAAALQCDSSRLADFLGVPVFGGDCIVRPDGTCVLIDFNDWPSFSRCREDAADAIAEIIISKH